MTDKLAELIADLNKAGSEIDGYNVAEMKTKIQGMDWPIKPFGFYVLVKMEGIQQTTTIKDSDGKDRELYLMSDNMQNLEQEAVGKGWILAFGPTAYRGFAGHGEDGMCADHKDWGCDVGDYVEFQSYGGIVSGFDPSKTIRYISDSNLLGKVKA